MGFETRTKASMEWRRVGQDDGILLELGSIETVGQQEEEWIIMSTYVERSRKTMALNNVAYVSLLR